VDGRLSCVDTDEILGPHWQTLDATSNILEPLSQSAQSPALSRSHRCHALPHYASRIGAVQSFDEPQDDHLTLVRIKGLNNLHQSLRACPVLKEQFGRTHDALLVLVDQRNAPLSTPAIKIKLKVVGYPQKPGYEWNSPPLVAVDGRQGLQEGLLGEVLGDINILGHVEQVSVDTTNVPLVQLPKRLAVSRYRLVDESRLFRRGNPYILHEPPPKGFLILTDPWPDRDNCLSAFC